MQPNVQDGHGRLFVHVKEGRNLAIKDKLTGTSDPYCISDLFNMLTHFFFFCSEGVLILGADKYHTEVIEKNLNPVWEDEEYFL